MTLECFDLLLETLRQHKRVTDGTWYRRGFCEWFETISLPNRIAIVEAVTGKGKEEDVSWEQFFIGLSHFDADTARSLAS